MVQIFVSHTKLDKECCNKLDIAAARVGLKVFRSEFEEIGVPAWKTIKDAINASSALFLIVGKELVKAQRLSESDPKAREDWKHTQNWISYEVGVACQLGIDVWVMCDTVTINFPVPYLNNYEIWGIQSLDPEGLKFMKIAFVNYSKKLPCPVGTVAEKVFKCPNCGAVYNLHSIIPKNMEVTCPTCLKSILLKNGWLLEDK